MSNMEYLIAKAGKLKIVLYEVRAAATASGGYSVARFSSGVVSECSTRFIPSLDFADKTDILKRHSIADMK